MKRSLEVALAFLAASTLASAHAAPVQKGGKQGLKNSKKVMSAMLERDRKMRVLRQQAQAKRQQLQTQTPPGGAR